MSKILYYAHMITTVDVPDDLLHHAEIVAVQRRTTLRELVIQGLAYATGSSGSSGDVDDQWRTRTEDLLGGLHADNQTPMRPLTREQVHNREDRENR